MGRGASKIGGAGGGTGNAPKDAKDMAGHDYVMEELRDKYEGDFDDATKKSVDKYISNTDFDGKKHSLSQVMNHLINQGVDLQTANLADINSKYGLSLTQAQLKAMQKTDANIDSTMHPLGMDMVLQRGCHAGELTRNFGIKDYTKMSEGELKAALVGGTFQNSAVMSTSWDVAKNPFLGSSSGVSGGREVIYNIKAGKNTKAVFGNMKQGEIILGKNTNWKVTDVKFTGKTAMPAKTMKEVPQVMITIETY